MRPGRRWGKKSNRSRWCMNPNAQPTRVESFDRSALAYLPEPPYTDPYVRWCGRGGAARLPPIPIPDPLRIWPNNHWAKQLRSRVAAHPNLPLGAMGFVGHRYSDGGKGRQLGRPYLGGCSSLLSEPVALSVFMGSGPSQFKHCNVRGSLPPGGSASIKSAPQLGQAESRFRLSER